MNGDTQTLTTTPTPPLFDPPSDVQTPEVLSRADQFLPAPPRRDPDQPYRSSEQIDQLIAGLAAAQLAFQAIDRNQTAHVESKRTGAKYTYGYADLGEVLNAVRPALAQNGIALLQFPVTRSKTLSITTLLAHTSGQWLQPEPLIVGLEGLDPQAIGSAITYARRYAVQALLGVAPGDDDDGAAASAKPAHSNGNGHTATVPMPARASAVAPPPPPATAPARLTIARLEKRRKNTGRKDAYWAVELSDGRQGLTFSTSTGEKLEDWFKANRAIAEAQFGKKDQWTYVNEITAAPL